MNVKYFIVVLALLTATISHAADVSLAWDPVDGATGYYVEMTTDPTTWTDCERRDAGADASFIWTGAPETGLLLFRAVAYNEAGTAVQTKSGAWFNATWTLPDRAVGLGVKSTTNQL